MAAKAPSTKRLLIDKANTRIVVYVSVAAFIVVFSLVATKSLISQAGYQNRVISAKRTAVNQLKANVSAVNNLKIAYDAYTSTTQNAIGGNSAGTGPNDGDNAKIVLDALPSTYDFPGLTSSLETLLQSQGVTINSIDGTDDEVAQSGNTSSIDPQPVPMPFQVSVSGDYGSIQKVIAAFEHSIRPFQIQTMELTGNDKSLTLTVSAQTYYQPAKSLSIGKKVVK